VAPANLAARSSINSANLATRSSINSANLATRSSINPANLAARSSMAPTNRAATDGHRSPPCERPPRAKGRINHRACRHPHANGKGPSRPPDKTAVAAE